MTEQGPPVSPQESNNDEGWNPVLDTDEIYDPDPEALAFFMAETGINDGMELRRHILAVQKEAFAVSNYVLLAWGEILMSLIGVQISLHPYVRVYAAQTCSVARVSPRPRTVPRADQCYIS